MYTCVIMHDMIVDDEGDYVETWRDDASANTANSFVLTDPPVHDVLAEQRNVMARETEMCEEEEAHTRLEADLIEEIWTHTNVF